MRIVIPRALLSYNAYYRNTRTGKRIKTGAGLAYDEEIEMILQDYASALKDFGKDIDLSKNIVCISIFHFKSGYYVKDGSRLSKTVGDWDNPIKIIQDKIFKVMGIDDCVVRVGKLMDLPSDKDGAIIELKLLDRPDIVSFDDFIGQS
jgi:hypothetical protein